MTPPPISPEAALDALRQAAEFNRTDPIRSGSLLKFPDYGQVVMTGDMHGHRRNFEKLCRYAMLDRAAARHVVLHELIHEDSVPGQPDTSWELLIRAAEYKCRFPEQVHFIQSNHELAQLTGQRISKGGRDVVAEFADAVTAAFGRDGPVILAAINELIASYPLAARLPHGVWLSHSLPDAQDMDRFDPRVVERVTFDPYDHQPGGDVYRLVWGRRHTPRLLERLAAAWDVNTFVIGHQPQDTGYDVPLDRLLIIASDHNHGVFVPIDLSRVATVDMLVSSIRKFVEVA